MDDNGAQGVLGRNQIFAVRHGEPSPGSNLDHRWKPERHRSCVRTSRTRDDQPKRIWVRSPECWVVLNDQVKKLERGRAPCSPPGRPAGRVTAGAPHRGPPPTGARARAPKRRGADNASVIGRASECERANPEARRARADLSPGATAISFAAPLSRSRHEMTTPRRRGRSILATAAAASRHPYCSPDGKRPRTRR